MCISGTNSIRKNDVQKKQRVIQKEGHTSKNQMGCHSSTGYTKFWVKGFGKHQCVNVNQPQCCRPTPNRSTSDIGMPIGGSALRQYEPGAKPTVLNLLNITPLSHAWVDVEGHTRQLCRLLSLFSCYSTNVSNRKSEPGER